MEFYRTLSEYYEEIFPLKEQQKKFFRDYLARENIGSILDAGCGTGAYVLEFSDWGIDAMGVDLSPEMVDIARRRGEERNGRARFAVADMLDLATVTERFDGILCTGNTLAHLAEKGQLQQALYQFRQKGENLLIQVVNYDRILLNKVTELPEIRTPNLVFRRYYKHLPNGLIEFCMEIELLAQVKTLGAVNTLLPLTRQDLEQGFAESGWKPVTWWGSFGGEDWSEDSPATIVAAKLNH